MKPKAMNRRVLHPICSYEDEKSTTYTRPLTVHGLCPRVQSRVRGFLEVEDLYKGFGDRE